MDEVKPLLVDLNQVAKIIGMSKGTVRSIIKTDKTFPKPIVFSTRIRRWKMGEINRWYSQVLGEKLPDEEPRKKRKYVRKPKEA